MEQNIARNPMEKYDFLELLPVMLPDVTRDVTRCYPLLPVALRSMLDKWRELRNGRHTAPANAPLGGCLGPIRFVSGLLGASLGEPFQTLRVCSEASTRLTSVNSAVNIAVNIG